MRSMFDDSVRREVLDRLRSLRPDSQARWGKMNAPQVVVHLSDQMRHTLGDATAKPQPGWLRIPLFRYLAIYWMPWPKGRIKGPPEAFVSKPAAWNDDVAALELLVERLGKRNPDGAWPEHAMFGPMTGRDWAVCAYKHFDHHLRQFAV